MIHKQTKRLNENYACKLKSTATVLYHN